MLFYCLQCMSECYFIVYSVCLNGQWDCNGDTCGNVNCTDDEFLCVEDNVCIPKLFHCDRMRDCSDGADEKNCSK